MSVSVSSRSIRFLLLSATAMPVALWAQVKPPPPPPPRRDSVSAEERAAVREVARDARSMARKRLALDSTTRAQRADSAMRSAFADPEARAILLKAREARVKQDSALRAYRATTTQRISMGMGARKLGLEKLLFRGDNVAQISWRRDVGVRVTPLGSRVTVPMASQSNGEIYGAVSIPYFPGRESLWFPSSNFGVVKTDVDEREIIHPIANGAEAYYRYESGDSVDIKLDGGRVIKLRELRITARRPDWRLFVGSFWFDRDGGQLVRAAYRLAVDIDIWDVASQETVNDRVENAEANRLRDSIARVRLPRDAYLRDSAMLARRRANNSEDDDPPAWVKATFRPAKARLDAITVEYGLYQGKFWLPRANSATASAQVGFIRVPFSIDEKFTYDEVNGDFTLAPIPAARLAARGGAAADSSVISGVDGSVSISVGGSDSTKRRTDSRPDSVLSQTERTRRRLCEKDSVYTRVDTRYEGALRIAYDVPCDTRKLNNSPLLPKAIADDEEVFDLKSRDELLAALDLSLQPAFMPRWPTIRVGSDLVRYNRVEGLSVGVMASSVLGAGYTLTAVGRIGHADLHANGELSLTRSNGARTVTGTVYHRLTAVNPEWAGALSLGPSLPALLYGRDEGFYFRNFGFELGEQRVQRKGAIDYRLFIERQWTAGDSDVVNTFSFAKLLGDRRFRDNILAEPSTFTGAQLNWSRVLVDHPRGLRLTGTTRLEAATGSYEYARGGVDGTLTRPIGRVAAALSGGIGSSMGRVPAQRGYYVGGLRTVRGQLPGTQSGDAYWLARAEVGSRQGMVRPVGFFDIGWAGSRTTFGRVQPQRGAGFGIGLLDGLLRMDISRGLYPYKRWRTDFYLEAPL
jgi:hypothetical protein